MLGQKDSHYSPRLNLFFNHKMIKICSFIAIAFYLLSMICYTISSTSVNSAMFLDSQLIALAFWSLAYTAAYCVLLSRLYFLYNIGFLQSVDVSSSPSSSPLPFSIFRSIFNVKYIFTILFIIAFVVGISMVVFAVEFVSSDWDNDVLLACIIVGFLSHIMFCVICLLLFVRQLFHLIFERTSFLLQSGNDRYVDAYAIASEDNEQKAVNEKRNSNFNKEQLELIEIVTRLTVLYCFTIFTSVLLLIVWGTFFAIEDKYEGRSDEIPDMTYLVCWWLFPADVFINFMCVLLNLEFTGGIYKYLCCCCHRLCGCLCLECSERILRCNDGVGGGGDNATFDFEHNTDANL